MYMSIVKAFNGQWIEFLEDLIKIFPNDYDLKTGLTWGKTVIRFTPLFYIKLWNEYIMPKYKVQIYNEDIKFFINNDYSDDISDIENKERGVKLIEKFRLLLRDASDINKQKSIKYVKNMSKLCELYYSK